MGCDIHGWIEVRRYSHSEKDWYATVDISYWERNYLVYARMFGVRNDFEGYPIIPIAASRGTPDAGTHDEYSNWRKKDLEYWKDDGHSYSWISYKEFKQNFGEITMPWGGYTNFQKWAILLQIMGSFAQVYGEDSVRLTVWFDN